MKSIISIFLTVTFVLYLGGVQLLYWIRIDTAKHNAAVFVEKNKIENTNIKVLSFTIQQYNSLQWSEKGKEFTLGGLRYDVKEVKHTLQGVSVSCYRDNEETEIMEAFQHFGVRLFNTQQKSGNGDNDIMSKITKEYLPLSILPIGKNLVEKTNNFIIVNDTPIVSSPVSDIWHPPATC